MKNSYKKLLSIILSLCLCIFIIPGTANAVDITESVIQTPAEMTDLEMIMAGIKTVEEVYGKLDEATVPEIVGYEDAVASNHIERLYADEGNDLNKVVFLNADGSKTAYFYDYPVKYIADDGKIRDITLKIEESENESFKTAENSTVTTFSAKATNGIALSGNGTSVVLVPKPPKSTVKSSDIRGTQSNDILTAKKINDKTVAYTYDAKTSIEYSLTYTGFKEDIVVSEYTGQTEYDFTLYTNGLELVCIDGSYYLVDSNDNIKATLGDIIIFTADEKNNTFGSMRSRTIRENEEYILTIVIDPEFLADENTAYPIRIDPTVEITYDGNGSSAISDVTINSLEGSSGTSSSLMIGKRQTYGISRVLMKFPGLDFDDLGSNVSITNATVRIRDILCETESLDIGCYIFTGNEWDESTVSWANVNAGSYSDLLSAKSVSYSRGVNQETAHWYVFNITNAVEGWRVGNFNPNKGIIFKAQSLVEIGFNYIHKTFASFNRASYKPSLSVTYSEESTLPVANDTYYLNNKYFGNYLHYNSSSISPRSGTLNELGSSIQWKIIRVGTGFIIRSATDSTKYLSVADDETNYSVGILTLVESTIPQNCIWNISIAAGTGCLIRSAYNDRYLYIKEYSEYDRILYTSATTGSSGTSDYYQKVWRLISKDNMTNKELKTNSVFHKAYVMSNYTTSIRLTPKPNGAIWSDLSDFNYECSNNNIATINEQACTITGTFPGIAVAYYTHKVTGIQGSFEINVINSLSGSGTLSYWLNCEDDLIGYWDEVPTVYIEKADDSNFNFVSACEYAIEKWSEALGIEINIISDKDAADIVMYGGKKMNLINLGYDSNLTNPGLTKYPALNFTNYAVCGNSVKILNRITKAYVYVLYDAFKTIDDYEYICTHELGHALGFMGHSSNSAHVMYHEVTSEQNGDLSSYEINHLLQMYVGISH